MIKEIASAPSASTAFAISVISVTFGESLIIRGFLETRLTSFTTLPAKSHCTPKPIPPFLTFGHEIFTSNASTSVSLNFSTTSQ